MNKSILLFFALLFLYAKFGPAIPFSTLTQSRGEPMVVTGEGKAVAVPDIAKVSAGITESGQTLIQLQDSVNKKSQNLVSALKKLGIEEKDIKTTSYNIFPQSDFRANLPRITGYSVSINYEITIRKIDKVNDVMTTLTDAGANLVGGVNFELSDDARIAALTKARAEAVTLAKKNAESLAKTTGVTLGKIINVTESQGLSPRPLMMTDKAVGVGSTPETPDIQPGTTEINLTVSLSYEIR